MSGHTFNAFAILKRAKGMAFHSKLSENYVPSFSNPYRSQEVSKEAYRTFISPACLDSPLLGTLLAWRDRPVKFVPSHVSFSDVGKPTFLSLGLTQKLRLSQKFPWRRLVLLFNWWISLMFSFSFLLFKTLSMFFFRTKMCSTNRNLLYPRIWTTYRQLQCQVRKVGYMELLISYWPVFVLSLATSDHIFFLIFLISQQNPIAVQVEKHTGIFHIYSQFGLSFRWGRSISSTNSFVIWTMV